MLVVQKYGGSSVANAARIKQVAQRICTTRQEGNEVVAVVSARGDATDELIALAGEISSQPPPREMDMLLATGEQQSIALLTMAINELGYPAVSLTGPQAEILTDEVHTKARILEVKTTRLRRELAQGKIVVVAGFQGMTAEGEVTTLGRGGSDTTAVAIAAALKADICEIYTDVDGVYTADPRVVPRASKRSHVSYEEMLELASLGAQVLQPRAVELALLHKVALHVRSSFHTELGTIIWEEEKVERKSIVTGIAHDLNIAKIALFEVPDRPGMAARIFNALAKENINVDMIIQSATRSERNDISFTVSRTDLSPTVAVVEKIQEEVGYSRFLFDADVAKVSIVGAGMITNPGVAAQMFTALAEEGINIQMISTSEIKVSCVVSAEEAVRAVNALHHKFNL